MDERFGAEHRIGVRSNTVTATGEARTGEIALNADDPIAGELIIAADLATENRAVRVDSSAVGQKVRARAEADHPHILLAPAPAAVGTHEAAGPAEGRHWRRDHRRGALVYRPRPKIGSTGGAGRDE